MYYTVSTTFIPLIYSVENEINMIEFAKHNIPNYDPDRGKGYYQLIDGSPEYISSQTDVILISEVIYSLYITSIINKISTECINFRIGNMYVLVLKLEK